MTEECTVRLGDIWPFNRAIL